MEPSASVGGSYQQTASAAPVSRVQSAPLASPIQSAPLAAPVMASNPAPVRAAPMTQTHVASGAPVRAMSHQAAAAPALPAPKQIASAPVRAMHEAAPARHEKIAAAPASIVAKPAAVTSVAKSEPVKKIEPAPVVAESKPVRTASLEPQTKAKSDAAPVATTATTASASDEAAPEFRWPARGRIIQGFKPGQSEGINIAVPEGTAVKAAEGGTVAYAGSELKGYGNLVLIRHPNGFVSAYAHNGELMVKRGDTVKRGQVIAKSGQSGNVSSPQLQFQLRKGSTPVDPTQYLAGL